MIGNVCVMLLVVKEVQLHIRKNRFHYHNRSSSEDAQILSFPPYRHRIGILDNQLDKMRKVSLIHVFISLSSFEKMYGNAQVTTKSLPALQKIMQLSTVPHSLTTWNEAMNEADLHPSAKMPTFFMGIATFGNEKTETNGRTFRQMEYTNMCCIIYCAIVFTGVVDVKVFRREANIVRSKLHFDRTQVTLEHWNTELTWPPPTILDLEAAQRLVKMQDFEVMSDSDEEYRKLEIAVTIIRESCRKKGLKYVTSRIAEPQLLKEKRNEEKSSHTSRGDPGERRVSRNNGRRTQRIHH